MNKFKLKEFFEKVDYDWTKDKEVLQEICRVTKTRARPTMPKDILVEGMEQPFFLKACADYFKPKKILEIGTGRGTGSYAMGLTTEVEKIVTLDIIPFQQKQNTAIGFQPAVASNADLFRLVKDEKAKAKIEFLERNDFSLSTDFDMAFIDGNHDDKEIIKKDFDICEAVLRNGGVIIWDDYNFSEFVVKDVVDEIAKKEDLKITLVFQKGHLFGDTKEDKNGMIIMSKTEIF